MNIQEKIKELTSIYGLSGAENTLAMHLCKELCDLGFDAFCDSFGNVIGRLNCGLEGAKTLLLEAHMDQIGLMVSDIKEDGIQFSNLGGVDQRILPGMEVIIHGKEMVYGIVGACISESKKENETEQKNLKIEEYRIETGLSFAEIKNIISVGDFISIQGDTISLQNSVISGPAMDNRAGIVAILNCLEELKKNRPAYDIVVLFSTQEELGLHGANAGIQKQKIDCAIVIDVTHGTTPDTKNEIGVFPLGCGAVICRGPNFHYSYTKQLIDLAKKKKIPYEIEVASAESGTTAWAIQTANGGIPVMLVSIPLRYMHTNVEALDCADVKAVAQLLFHTATGGVEIA